MWTLLPNVLVSGNYCIYGWQRYMYSDVYHNIICNSKGEQYNRIIKRKTNLFLSWVFPRNTGWSGGLPVALFWKLIPFNKSGSMEILSENRRGDTNPEACYWSCNFQGNSLCMDLSWGPSKNVQNLLWYCFLRVGIGYLLPPILVNFSTETQFPCASRFSHTQGSCTSEQLPQASWREAEKAEGREGRTCRAAETRGCGAQTGPPWRQMSHCCSCIPEMLCVRFHFYSSTNCICLLIFLFDLSRSLIELFYFQTPRTYWISFYY